MKEETVEGEKKGRRREKNEGRQEERETEGKRD